MASVAAIAHADPSDLFAQHDDFAPVPNTIGPPAPHRSFQWDNRKNRWGLSLDVAQPSDRDVQWRDTRLGLNYRIGTNLHTGVGVALGPEQTPDGHNLDSVTAQPRVRLQTIFNF
jgi:hypothetical protein